MAPSLFNQPTLHQLPTTAFMRTDPPQLIYHPAMANQQGRIIILNGTSSAGKSTLAQALRLGLESQFHFYSSDQLAGATFRPLDEEIRSAWREKFFDGFHRSIPAFASAGIDLLIEHIVEEEHWAAQLQVLLSPFDVFWVGVHAPVAEIERRERSRGNRQIGEGLYHLKTHDFCSYDVEVDTTKPETENVIAILNRWKSRPPILLREAVSYDKSARCP